LLHWKADFSVSGVEPSGFVTRVCVHRSKYINFLWGRGDLNIKLRKTAHGRIFIFKLTEFGLLKLNSNERKLKSRIILLRCV
jgi:hypothetical protein